MIAEAETEFPSLDPFVFDGVLLSSRVIVGMAVGAEVDPQADRINAITMIIIGNDALRLRGALAPLRSARLIYIFFILAL